MTGYFRKEREKDEKQKSRGKAPQSAQSARVRERCCALYAGVWTTRLEAEDALDVGSNEATRHDERNPIGLPC
jgi:hypothetical protein